MRARDPRRQANIASSGKRKRKQRKRVPQPARRPNGSDPSPGRRRLPKRGPARLPPQASKPLPHGDQERRWGMQEWLQRGQTEVRQDRDTKEEDNTNAKARSIAAKPAHPKGQPTQNKKFSQACRQWQEKAPQDPKHPPTALSPRHQSSQINCCLPVRSNCAGQIVENQT